MKDIGIHVCKIWQLHSAVLPIHKLYFESEEATQLLALIQQQQKHRYHNHHMLMLSYYTRLKYNRNIMYESIQNECELFVWLNDYIYTYNGFL